MEAFIISKILISYFIGYLIVGKYISIGLKFMMQGLCMLCAFYLEGIVIGIIT